MDLTPDQLAQLQSLGIAVSNPTVNISDTHQNNTEEIKQPQTSSPSLGQISNQTISSSRPNKVLKPSINPIVPLLSVSGLTLLSFGGIVLFKNKETTPNITSIESGRSTQRVDNVPTQVPKSIQHYLLTSQQLFTQALSLQANAPKNQRPSELSDLLNQSILAATDAIKQFPDDYRGYDQRGRIYQSLVDSNLPTDRQAPFLKNAIADLVTASRLNPDSAQITRTLASLFAKTGDVPHTLSYLSQTVSLEPTNPQNFYDLARLQTQAGYIPQALDTYTRLLTLVSDPVQKQQVAAEKTSLEKLVAQNPGSASKASPSLPINQPSTSPQADGPLLQADAGGGLIIAAPETSKNISVSSLTDSNALAGTGTLPANTVSVVIPHSQLLPTSQVYLAITQGGKNQTLQVLSRSQDSFTVGLDSSINEDISFKWWIVNP